MTWSTALVVIVGMLCTTLILLGTHGDGDDQ